MPGPSDTDPSTPAAIQPTKIVTVSGPQGATQKVSTDPGVAPPANAPRVSHDADTDPGPVPRSNDSIDTLLDGITGPRAERVKTLPTSAGSAAAAYGTSHRPMPKHDTPPYEPSVIVDPEIAEAPAKATTPRSLVPTLKLDRAQVQALLPNGVLPSPQQEQPTVIVPRASTGKLVLIIGGVAVVAMLGILVVGRMWANRAKQVAVPTSTSAAATQPAVAETTAAAPIRDVPPPPLVETTPAVVAPPATTSVAAATTSAPKPVASIALAPVAPTTSAPKPKPKATATATSDTPVTAPTTTTTATSSKIDRDYRLGE